MQYEPAAEAGVIDRYVIDRYSEIEFAFAQKSPSPWVTTITVLDTDWVPKGGREDVETSL